MKNFFDWLKDRNLELPEALASQPPLESDEGEEATTEARKRTGAKEGLYPDQYYGGQYPPLAKTPPAADSAYYQSIKKDKKK